ncbi:translesion error-prone DNA polymerase V autoproteolytic subunit [Cytophagaceae bacterium DM2B3-1]|uniref:Translesion error-prone DNA polymerase V autoproteolytic subunit n=1 Tax=Xanthocytophaga flava TaxID=3048013 RepID=A0AAE3QM76_9BACT|nr:translesion error-prone DNA polymerase V autoproteolytic subunit [Xanthocytophaga flavus]MDJ1467262.1 translesion error-prone DNA polymerase V autoproteolytic subunit [Xanthocytophaga flavus]MDJ1479938.1 translesion error-prone DNA polymerase V autoproteolytic subunit [Xanthocytophaga flavus]MDJ1494766.1 translesion error-prone DNA polymerase V autoproteolytic subunit [Xanthocytophaga flavus]
MRALQLSRIQKLDTLPASAYQFLEVYKPLAQTHTKLPIFESLIPLGFPSPADDYIDRQLDLNDMLIQNKLSTFYLRVVGDSMKGCGIFDNALIIVDKSKRPKDGNVVLAVINGEFTCKRLKIENRKVYLCPENKDYTDILITEDMNFLLWGVVTYAINPFS